ncbi:MAG: hypothetical protein QW327_05100 [Candidatus Odinarchaeota archaeon]
MSLITTSRHPAIKARVLIKDLSHLLPNCLRINRGKASLSALVMKALQNSKHTIIIVDSKKSIPDSLHILQIGVNARILNDFRILITGFEEKTSVSSLRAPETAPRYYLIDENLPNQVIDKISEISKSLGLNKIDNAQLNNISGVVFYFKLENNTVTLKFYLAPSMDELGPRLKIQQIVKGG